MVYLGSGSQNPSFSMTKNGLISFAMKTPLHRVISAALGLGDASGVANPPVSVLWSINSFLLTDGCGLFTVVTFMC